MLDIPIIIITLHSVELSWVELSWELINILSESNSRPSRWLRARPRRLDQLSNLGSLSNTQCPQHTDQVLCIPVQVFLALYICGLSATSVLTYLPQSCNKWLPGDSPVTVTWRWSMSPTGPSPSLSVFWQKHQLQSAINLQSEDWKNVGWVLWRLL